MTDSKLYFQDSLEEAFQICKDKIKECLFSEKRTFVDISQEMARAELAISQMNNVLLEKKLFCSIHRQNNILQESYKQLFSSGLKCLSSSLDQRIQTIVNDLESLMIRKQRDYGKGNIMIFGHVGIMVRVSDKVERIKNLVASGRKPENESILDSYRDMCNYGLIGLMVLNGTFMRELKNEE